MAKFKAGLHKKVAAIFDGVPMQTNDVQQQPIRTSMPAFIREQHDEVRANPVVLTPPSPSVPKPRMPLQPQNAPLPKQSKDYETAKPSIQIQLQEIWQKLSAKLFTPKLGVDAKKQKIMVVLIPVLFIVLIIVLTQVLGGAAPKSSIAQDISAAKGTAASSIDWRIPEQYPTTIRDPMQKGSSSSAPGAQDGGLVVKGILYTQDKASAVIGSQIVHQGQTISGVTVRKINKDSVEFEMDGKKWTQQVQK